MTEEDLKTLAEAIHAITYMVPGHITSFVMDFDHSLVLVEWDDETECFRVVV